MNSLPRDLTPSRVNSHASAKRKIPLSLAIVGLALAIAGAWGMWQIVKRTYPPAPAGQFMELGISLPNNFLPVNGTALSPDGSTLAIGVVSISPQIMLHSFEKSETQSLAGTSGGYNPFWSPDSKTLAYFAANKLLKISPSGGEATTVAELPSPLAGGGAWSRSGTMLFVSGSKIYRVPATGGTPVEVALQGMTGAPVSVQFLPDDRHLIFFEARGSGGRGGAIQLASLDAPGITKLVDSEYPGVFAAPDRLLFVQHTSLIAQHLDMRRHVLTGEPAVIATGVSSGVVSADTALALAPSVSDDGKLVFSASRAGSRGELRWFTRDGNMGESIGPPRADLEYLNPAFSPDAKFVAVNRMDPESGTWDIWLIDTTSKQSSRLTTDVSSESDPVWSPDGKDIAYLSDRYGAPSFYRVPVTGGQPVKLLTLNDAIRAVPTDWSHDYLLYERFPTGSMWALPLTGDPTPKALGGMGAVNPRLSPDGRWLAYGRYEDGQWEIFVKRFLADGPATQISHGGGVYPRWTRDGREIVYWTPPGGIFASDINIIGNDIVAGPARTLVDRPVLNLIDGRPHYDITRDGQKLLVRQPAGPPGPSVRVIVNWTSKIAQ